MPIKTVEFLFCFFGGSFLNSHFAHAVHRLFAYFTIRQFQFHTKRLANRFVRTLQIYFSCLNWHARAHTHVHNNNNQSRALKRQKIKWTQLRIVNRGDSTPAHMMKWNENVYSGIGNLAQLQYTTSFLRNDSEYEQKRTSQFSSEWYSKCNIHISQMYSLLLLDYSVEALPNVCAQTGRDDLTMESN